MSRTPKGAGHVPVTGTSPAGMAVKAMLGRWRCPAEDEDRGSIGRRWTGGVNVKRGGCPAEWVVV